LIQREGRRTKDLIVHFLINMLSKKAMDHMKVQFMWYHEILLLHLSSRTKESISYRRKNHNREEGKNTVFYFQTKFG
jgi:hypothetical protein